MTRCTRLSLGFLLWLGCLANTASAIAPIYVSDVDLAAAPIIVEAVWDKAPFEVHAKFAEGDMLKEVPLKREYFTKLRVLRTVKGPDIPPGEHILFVTDFGISWNKDGKHLNSGTSTQLPGEVDDVTQPNLWFLWRKKSWDPTRPLEQLYIDNYRAIQALKYESYYAALASKEPTRETPKLLASDDHEVRLRVLQYLVGGVWPWPYDPDEFEKSYLSPLKRGKILKQEAPRVLELIDQRKGPDRPYAVSVYAHLAGALAHDKLRSLLSDKDADVRGTALSILVRDRDESFAQQATALEGLTDEHLSCKLVQAYAKWGEDRVVPCLISFLENDGFSYQDGEDVGIPALQARQALKRITGHWFPYNLVSARAIWKQVAAINDKEEQRKQLAKLLPGRESPLIAELTGEPVSMLTAEARAEGRTEFFRLRVRVQNVSSEPVALLKSPTTINISTSSYSSSRGSGGFGAESPPEDFVKLAPDATLELEVDVVDSFLIAEPKTREITLDYYELGNIAGAKSWIGALKVTAGKDWKHVRDVQKVEKLWPNGNLKEVGVTVNGQKFGEWHYFNEAGDRTHISHYFSGRGSGETNPEHPSNKGAGIRKK